MAADQPTPNVKSDHIACAGLGFGLSGQPVCPNDAVFEGWRLSGSLQQWVEVCREHAPQLNGWSR